MIDSVSKPSAEIAFGRFRVLPASARSVRRGPASQARRPRVRRADGPDRGARRDRRRGRADGAGVARPGRRGELAAITDLGDPWLHGAVLLFVARLPSGAHVLENRHRRVIAAELVDAAVKRESAAGMTRRSAGGSRLPVGNRAGSGAHRRTGRARACVRLDDRLRLLVGGRRTALSRREIWRATLDWSYELLPDPEGVVLRRLLSLLAFPAWRRQAQPPAALDWARKQGALPLELRAVTSLSAAIARSWPFRRSASAPSVRL
jgi:hypothetical protein